MRPDQPVTALYAASFIFVCTTAGGRLEYNYPYDMKQSPTPTNHNISHFYCWSIVSKKINKIQNHVDLDLDCTNKMFQFGTNLTVRVQIYHNHDKTYF